METLGEYEIKPSSSDILLEYQRKMKDHLMRVQARYETKISNLENMLDARNEIIDQLKSLLKEKQ